MIYENYLNLQKKSNNFYNKIFKLPPNIFPYNEKRGEFLKTIFFLIIENQQISGKWVFPL